MKNYHKKCNDYNDGVFVVDQSATAATAISLEIILNYYKHLAYILQLTHSAPFCSFPYKFF